jgi:hypothetical protein
MTSEQKEFVDNLGKMNLYPECHYSTFTEKFYWNSKLNVKDGEFILGIVEHRDSPEEALDAYKNALKNKYLVADINGVRKEFMFV